MKEEIESKRWLFTNNYVACEQHIAIRERVNTRANGNQD